MSFRLRRFLWTLVCADEGTATVEFALVFPIALFLCLVLLQTTLLMVGNMFVHYAAFAATRAAIAQIPRNLTVDGEPVNVIVAGEGAEKFDTIRQAAVLAVMPVSGRSHNGSVAADAFVSGLEEHYAGLNQETPKWVHTLAADRLRYAAANTQVTLLRTKGDADAVSFVSLNGGLSEFGPREAVTVRVEHRFFLSVPYVSAIFADGESDEQGGRFTLIAAQYTLTNEGIPVELPPEPELPRDP